jgi:hypothetical protein
VKEAFINKNRQAKTLATIEQVNRIIEEYYAQNYRMTVRQVFYQTIARNLFPNTPKTYRDVQTAIRRGRLEGLIDWDAIEDRTREVVQWRDWLSPQTALEEAAERYAQDPWLEQKFRPVVWIEKAALANMIEQACADWHVPYFACRGYNSLSEQYQTGKKLAALIAAGATPVILHLGDHDPSGLDMTRDNTEQLSLFAGQPIEVRRLALTMEQVQRYRPPPNPAKETHKRFADYRRRYGRKCWELDALEPTVIDTLVRDAIKELVNQRKWKAAQAREIKNKQMLEDVVARWEDVVELVKEARE